jgi:predicted nuclease of predicted toxin-antitoxin system
VVVTKDRDFRNPHLLRQAPKRLLLVLTGNTSNSELLAIVGSNLGGIVAALEEVAFVELTPTRLIVHGATPEE